MTTPQDNIPHGFCHCGCGQKTNLFRGVPYRYRKHHHPQSKDGIERIRAGRMKHGNTSFGEVSATYNTWRAMIDRCTNPNADNYPRYGGRGVSICERWMVFSNFLADMGDRPDGKTLDRFPDNKGNYEPNNCRWATPKEQLLNGSRIVWVVCNGEKMPLKYAARTLGINISTLTRWLKIGKDVPGISR